MKKMLRSLRKNWIRVWLISAIVLSSMFAAYAAYTEVSSVKRVVSMQHTPEQRFSSNCMDITKQMRRLTTPSFEITVCNYDQNKPDVFETEKITYTLNAYLQVRQNGQYIDITGENDITGGNYSAYNSSLDSDNTDELGKLDHYTIQKVYDDADSNAVDANPNGFASGTVTYSSQQLAGGHSSMDRYRITIDEADLDIENAQVFLYVEAIRTGSATTIKGLLYGQKASSQAAKWSGKITDAHFAPAAEGGSPEVDYDFYNYLISGSGKGTVDVLWNPYQFKINEYFLDIYKDYIIDWDVSVKGVKKISSSESGQEDTAYSAEYNEWNMITLDVDSTERSRYELQLFKVKEKDFNFTPIPYGYDDNNNRYIVCKFPGVVTGSGA